MGTPNTITNTVKESKTFIDRITGYLPKITIPGEAGQEAVSVSLKDAFVWAQGTTLSMAKNLIGSPPAVVKVHTNPPQKKIIIIKQEDPGALSEANQKFWDENDWGTWLIFSGELMMGAGAIPAMVDSSIYTKEEALLIYTGAGFGFGAALGNLACRPIDSPAWYFACQGLTGLAGAGLAFGLSYALLEDNEPFSSGPPTMLPPPPDPGPDHRWPTDSYGP